MFNRIRRTKIVVTLGPSTDSDDVLKKIILSGANVLRLNFSHGTKEEHIKRAKRAFKIIKETGSNIAILGDLQGPKIRISKFKNNQIFLNKGDSFILDYSYKNKLGNKKKVGFNYKNLIKDIFIKNILLLDDGKIQLVVLNVKKTKIYTKVLIGGFLENNKGINKLGGGLNAGSITNKDRRDIITASKIKVDYLAISFPKCAKDLEIARKLMKKAGSNAKIIAKIERAEAVHNDQIIQEIILASDAIMVARGDLGIEIGDPELAGMQKKLIRKARQLNRVVITATQMMESMIFNLVPTRAEVMDVANAVLDGSDAVMLSSETASGRNPVETVISMSKVCKGAEKIPSMNVSRHRMNLAFDSIEEIISMSTMYSANHLNGVKAIITMTESGKTALITSRISSGLPIFALSRNIKTLKLTALYRGVIPIFFKTKKQGLEASKKAIKLLCEKKYLKFNDIVIITQGDIKGIPGNTNTMRILKVTKF
ncbi:MAG: pyruvate kinase [Buchnera aphidicola (Periphyllus lyropictus)]|uniref:pyruvate kinase n=1 Tax=Buchnera aphidicola TaxID=9 RepID=UPI001EB59B30|nr:pyruvate kinase [Buchnera aphidicola]NIH16817.1 pyruvate kinase [Buchnera aphidicola (Periphyllus lyropictus)]USS94499.1 pyruvate kinase [Buchnera aphidicola (Periphyllus lyropictus)]